MKNGFYFILKLFLLLRYLNHCSDLFGHVGKWPEKKVKLNSKISQRVTKFDNTSQIGKQTITIHILPDVCLKLISAFLSSRFLK